MFGRDRERAQLEHMLDGLATGLTGFALEGAPGIGKTTLWRSTVASARRRGCRVIEAAPGEPDAALPFAGLGDLLDGLDADALDALPDPQRRALAAALFLGDAAAAPSDPQALPRAALNVLRGMAARAPLLIAIDDEQWLDRSSARVLAFALCRLRDERVGVLLARRGESAGALWPELARGFGADGLCGMTLEPLDMSAVHRLLSSNLNRTIPRPLLRRIYDASGGNPLYALAIARQFEATDAGGSGERELPIPRTLADAVGRRLEQLDSRACDPLLVAAALSGPTIALIQSVLPDFKLSDLDSAERADVVQITGGRVRFTHPLLASTHYARAPAARRRALHRLLAEVVAGEEERAHHLALGAEAPDRRVAVALEQAAGDAGRRGAPEVAAELLEHACRLTPPSDAVDALHSRTVAAAEQHWLAGDLERARGLLEAVLEDLPGGPIRARALKQLARIRTDDFDVSAALFEEALAEAGDHHRVGSQIESQYAEVWFNRGDQNTGMEHAKAAVWRAERAGDPGLLAGALATQGIAAFFHGDGIQHDTLTRAIGLEDVADEISSYYLPSTSLGNQLFWSDQLDAGRPLLERSLRRAIERGEEYDRGGLLFHLAHLEWEAGRNEIAARHMEELAESALQQVDDQADSYLLWLQAFTAARHGDLDQARERADDAAAVAGRIGDQFIVAFSTAIVAEVDLWTGHPDAAHDRLAPLREALGATFVGSLTLTPWWCDIEALIATGRLDQAEVVLDELTERAERAENPNAVAIARRCAGLLLAARGSLGEAIEAMDGALARHALRPVAFELGRTLLEKGTLERRAKRKSAAKRSLEQALATLEPLDAAMWIARTRDELGRIGLRRPAVSDGLTPAQTRVAELVASGMSNREIAATLYMSLRTVETHLTKIYRQLGVRSRAQLVGSMLAGPADEALATTAARDGSDSVDE